MRNTCFTSWQRRVTEHRGWLCPSGPVSGGKKLDRAVFVVDILGVFFLDDDGTGREALVTLNTEFPRSARHAVSVAARCCIFDWHAVRIRVQSSVGTVGRIHHELIQRGGAYLLLVPEQLAVCMPYNQSNDNQDERDAADNCSSDGWVVAGSTLDTVFHLGRSCGVVLRNTCVTGKRQLRHDCFAAASDLLEVGVSPGHVNTTNGVAVPWQNLQGVLHSWVDREEEHDFERDVEGPGLPRHRKTSCSIAPRRPRVEHSGANGMVLLLYTDGTLHLKEGDVLRQHVVKLGHVLEDNSFSFAYAVLRFLGEACACIAKNVLRGKARWLD